MRSLLAVLTTWILFSFNVETEAKKGDKCLYFWKKRNTFTIKCGSAFGGKNLIKNTDCEGL